MPRRRTTGPTRKPSSGVTHPPEYTDEMRLRASSVIKQNLKDIEEQISEALAVAEAEGILKTTKTDTNKTRAKIPANISSQNVQSAALRHLGQIEHEVVAGLAPRNLPKHIIGEREWGYILPQPWWEPFFIKLCLTGSMIQAASVADVSYRQILNVKSCSPTFNRLYEIAMSFVTSVLEEEAMRRALAGSDLLMIFMLKGANRAKYGDKVEVVKPEVVRSKAAALANRLGMDPDELLRLAEEIAAENADVVEGEFTT